MIGLVLTLAGKDWRLFWADRRAALLSFVVPIVLASVFGVLFDRPIGTQSTLKLPLIIVAEDDGTFTQAVVADLLSSPRTEAIVLSREEAEKRVADRRPGVAVVLPLGFEQAAKWKSDAKPNVEILHNPLCSTEAQWAEGVVTEVIMKRVAKATLPVSEEQIAPPFKTVTSPVTGSHHAKFNSYSHSFSGMTIQYLLFWGMESGLLLLRERNRGVWRRMKAAPVPLTSMVLGKALATALIALLQIGVTFTFGRIVFGVSITGSWTGFLLLAGAVSLLAAATGLAVAAIGGTEGRARSISILVILGVSMLGGLWVPAFVLPSWARDLAMALPTTWAMRGLDGVTWQGASWGSTIPYSLAVAGFAVVFFCLAAYRLIANDNAQRQGKTL